MAATYDSALPTVKDQGRFLFRDLDSLDAGVVGFPILQDEEYVAAINLWGDVEGLAKCAEAIGADWVQLVNKYANTKGGTSVTWPDRAGFYYELAASLRINGLAVLTVRAGAPPLPSPIPYVNAAGKFVAADERLTHL